MVRLQLAQMHGSPCLVQSRIRWISFSKPRNGYFLRRLLHTWQEMRSVQLHTCQMERLVRALGAEVLQIKTSLQELWKAVLGQRAQAPLSALCAGLCCGVDRDCNHRPCSARGQRRGDSFLTQTRKRHWRCEELENHRVAQPHWKGMGISIGSSTCASSRKSCRPMPVWLTHRKEHARCSSHPGKRV